MTSRWRYRVPKIARHAALGHRSGCDLENQSRGRRRSSCRRSATVLTGTGSSEPSLLNARCKVRSVAATTRPRICFSDLTRSTHRRSRWMLNGYFALMRSTSPTSSMELHGSSDALRRQFASRSRSRSVRNRPSAKRRFYEQLHSLGERSRERLESSRRSGRDCG
jgi:hypothetical protein